MAAQGMLVPCSDREGRSSKANLTAGNSIDAAFRRVVEARLSEMPALLSTQSKRQGAGKECVGENGRPCRNSG
jgi:hypothetical protein